LHIKFRIEEISEILSIIFERILYFKKCEDHLPPPESLFWQEAAWRRRGHKRED
jgi:hypothetical protein